MAVLLLLLGTAPAARANGTSMGTFHGSPEGGVYPLQSSEVRLVEEQLRIELLDGLECTKPNMPGAFLMVSCRESHYRVHARYTLSNPKRPARVLFGVPLMAADARKQASRIRIRVGGIERRCRPAPDAKRPVKPLATVAQILQDGSTDRFEGMFLEDNGWESWCVAQVTIPRGERVPLDLRYTGELIWDDWLGPDCSYWSRERHLLYPLSPAGYWAGTPDRVRIEVDLGRYADLSRVRSPAGFSRSGNIVRWELRGVSLKQVKDVHVVVDVTRFHLPHVGFDRAPWERDKVSARSVDTGATADAATDGRSESVWCPAATNRPASLEVRIHEHPYAFTWGYPKPDSPHMDPFWFHVVGVRVRDLEKNGLFQQELPGSFWSDAEHLRFIVLPKGSNMIDSVRLSTCERPELAVEQRPPRAPGQMAVVLDLEGELRRAYFAELKAWGDELLRRALPCIKQCKGACAGKEPKIVLRGKSPAGGCLVFCEIGCVHRVAQKVEPQVRRPCVRVTLTPRRGRRVCISEIVPQFRRCW